MLVSLPVSAGSSLCGSPRPGAPTVDAVGAQRGAGKDKLRSREGGGEWVAEGRLGGSC